MTEKVAPICANDIMRLKLEYDYKNAIANIPEDVIRIFNDEIIKNYIPQINTAKVKQDEVVKRITVCFPFKSRQAIFVDHWLDIEPIFEKTGWHVQYHKSAYYEPESSYWTFRKKE